MAMDFSLSVMVTPHCKLEACMSINGGCSSSGVKTKYCSVPLLYCGYAYDPQELLEKGFYDSIWRQNLPVMLALMD